MTDGKHHIDKEQFQQYLKGELRGEAAHNLEKQLLDSWFASEAMEGAEKIRPEEFSKDMAALQSKLTTRVERPKAGYKVPGALKIAASVLLLAAAGFLIVKFTDLNPLPKNELSTVASKDLQPDSMLQDSSLIALNQILPEEEEGMDPDIADSEIEPMEEVLEAEVVEAPPIPDEEDQAASGFSSEIALDQQIEEDSIPLSTQILGDMASAESLDVREQVATLQEITLSRSKSAAQAQPVAGKIAGEEFTPAQASSILNSQRASNIVYSGKTIRGRVFSRDEAGPLPGVAVSEPGTSNSALTDSKGEFSIEIQGEARQLQFNYGGFQSLNVDIVDSTNMEIFLVADPSTASDISIVGNGELVSDATFIPAEPVDGNRSYRQYLDTNLRYPQAAVDAGIEGKVVVQVSVAEDGTLSNFQVINSLGSGCDEEAIRLIREGPAWTPSKLGPINLSENVRITVRFKR